MKKLLYYMMLGACLMSTPAWAQDYRGENKVFIRLETLKDGLLVYESDKLTVDINEELNTFDLAVDMQSFRPVDEKKADMTLWNTLFHEEYHSELSYKADFPTMKLDAQSDNKQQLEINGTLFLGELKLTFPLKLEWIQMDRFVFVDFNTKVSYTKLGVEIPEKYKQVLTGTMYIEVLNGKLITGFR